MPHRTTGQERGYSLLPRRRGHVRQGHVCCLAPVDSRDEGGEAWDWGAKRAGSLTINLIFSLQLSPVPLIQLANRIYLNLHNACGCWSSRSGWPRGPLDLRQEYVNRSIQHEIIACALIWTLRTVLQLLKNDCADFIIVKMGCMMGSSM